MQGLKDRADGLVLLTATPMQVRPVELWSPGNPLFRPPEGVDARCRDWPSDTTLKDVLDG